MRIWSSWSVLEKMQFIKRRIRLRITALLLYWSMLEEVNCLILLLKLGSFLRKLQEHTFIKWWMDFTICIPKVLHIGILSLRMSFYRIFMYSKLQILGSLAYSRARMVLESCILSLVLKVIWLLRYQQKSMKEKVAISSLQEWFYSSCTLEILLSRRHHQPTHITRS